LKDKFNRDQHNIIPKETPIPFGRNVIMYGDNISGKLGLGSRD
jgi:hypothetical protein